MKTKFLAIALVIATGIANAQIKVLSTGQVGICTTTVPTGYMSNIVGGKTQIGLTSAVHSYLTVEAWGSDIRLSGNTGKVVFYGATGFNNIECKTLTQNSDARNKTNIADIKEGLRTVKKLKGVSYNWKADSNKKGIKKDFGFLAQDVEQIIPDAVVTSNTDTTDNKMIAYSSFIPYLVEAIKELADENDLQKQQISQLTAQLNKGKNKSANESNLIDNATNPSEVQAVLYQNNPNPFSTQTKISFYLPTTVKAAILNIYDLQGNQLRTIAIQNRENAFEIINGTELKEGMYYYTLIADGVEVDTKRMILTK